MKKLIVVMSLVLLMMPFWRKPFSPLRTLMPEKIVYRIERGI